MNICTGRRQLDRENVQAFSDFVFDNQGRLRLGIRESATGREVVRIDTPQPRVVFTCNPEERCHPIGFSSDNEAFYVETNRGQSDLARLGLVCMETGEEISSETDSLQRVDFGYGLFSASSNKLLASIYLDDRPRFEWKDRILERDYLWLESRLASRNITIVSRSRDERIWMIVAADDNEPGEIYSFDRKKRTLLLKGRLFGGISRHRLATTKAVRYESYDGLAIEAYLTLPNGVEPFRLPTVLVPHGGPWARDYLTYNPLWQFLANRGYAVLAPNFRGSSGYGKKFLEAGNGEWGGKMQDDLTAGVQWLVGQGIADSSRLGIVGWSYGGYAASAGLTFTPELFAAGVSVSGPSNLLTFVEASLNPKLITRVGSPNTPKGRARLERVSRRIMCLG